MTGKKKEPDFIEKDPRDAWMVLTSINLRTPIELLVQDMQSTQPGYHGQCFLILLLHLLEEAMKRQNCLIYNVDLFKKTNCLLMKFVYVIVIVNSSQLLQL